MKQSLLAIALGLSAGSVFAADVSINGNINLKSEKEVASNTAASLRDSAINAGLGAVVEGKSAKDSAKAAADAAKAEGLAKATQAKNQAAEKYGMATAAVAGYKQNAAMLISVSDRAALAKHYAASNATSAALGRMLGTSAAKVELKLGAKLDTGNATAVDSAVVAKLGKQPAGTALYKVNNSIVRVESKTNVIVDIAAISPK